MRMVNGIPYKWTEEGARKSLRRDWAAWRAFQVLAGSLLGVAGLLILFAALKWAVQYLSH